ncbi:MAG: alkaline phosphatase family protein [Candidatus Thorarchaeota archaeon]
MKKTIIIGWDGIPPRLAFDELLPYMPNLQSLLKESNYGPLRSCRPPVTIPAWMSMMTGLDPGQLGLYGFRHRIPGDYTGVWIPNSQNVTEPKIWDILGEMGADIAILGIPPSFPPLTVNGISISGILTPDIDDVHTYPEEFADQISRIAEEYTADIMFRTEDKESALKDLLSMTAMRHQVVMHILSNEKWDLFAMVEIGSDRLHHAFWKYYDTTHHLFTENKEFNDAFIDYYRLLDKQLGEILSIIPEDTLFILASDHGAKGMKGAFCINQWLYKKGLLKLVEYPSEAKPLSEVHVDWANTKAWAWGGYCATIFINVEGYEKEGIVDSEEYEGFRSKLANELKEITGPNGEKWATLVEKPEEAYSECNGYYPDLLVYFDDLSWRTAGSIGHPSIYLSENDTGPDDAVHDWDGIYVVKFPGQKEGKREARNILDIAPTVLEFVGAEKQHKMNGKAIRSE